MKISAKSAQKPNVLSTLVSYHCLLYLNKFHSVLVSDEYYNFYIVVNISFSRERWLLCSSVAVCSKRNY